MGCSNGVPKGDKLELSVPEIREVKPVRPAPIKIYNEPFKACGGNVCLTPKEAQRSLDNKVEIGRWMGEANGVMDYYENRKVIPGAAARRF